jgi:hypothetical protein
MHRDGAACYITTRPNSRRVGRSRPKTGACPSGFMHGLAQCLVDHLHRPVLFGLSRETSPRLRHGDQRKLDALVSDLLGELQTLRCPLPVFVLVHGQLPASYDALALKCPRQLLQLFNQTLAGSGRVFMEALLMARHVIPPVPEHVIGG